MEDNRRKPSQPENETDFTEVILEPIQDIGLPKKRTNGVLYPVNGRNADARGR